MVVVDPKIFARTERLLLRPLRVEDAADVLLMRRHPEVMKHTSLLPCNDIEATKAWIQGCHAVPGNWNFSIVLLAPHSGPHVIGLIGAVRAPEIGYMFNAAYWGNGYATEALRAFMPLFFKHYSGREIASYECADVGDEKDEAGHGDKHANGMAPRFEYAEALTDTELVPSQNVLIKVGFRLHEKREKDFENPVLGWRDTLVYRMYRPDANKDDAML
ncbi:acyl-CoA N-acyltransferase [Decorospora gaudefroyi]|uniref:Acyl-CoA N-acyltransferase n=1 Tax=Decorospora gaudefroyi TaxID=184978 RepID=A0A6A5KU26_9PLEO|nr:acyl-CoA N-acyltransferase [Decorospora gaudefroyi]